MRTERLLSGMVFINLALLALPACEIHSISGNLPTGAGGSGGATASSSSGVGGASSTSSAGGATATSGAGGGTPCAPAAAFVYSIATDHTLSRLDPVEAGTWTSTSIGTITCPTPAEPYSIAIDRSGQAWVGYSDGKLFKVDTATAACTATSFVVGQHGFLSFSMAFLPDAPGSDAETLYLGGSGLSGSSNSLATLDRTTLTLTPVGAYDNAIVAGPMQLVGKSDGTLLAGFVTNSQYDMALIDPASAHVTGIDTTPSLLIDKLPPTAICSAIAWGKYFHIFTTTSEGTRDYRSNPEQGVITSYGGALGLTPMIALTIGASTCATGGDKPL